MTSLEQLLREAMDEHTSSAPPIRTGMAHAALRGSRRTRHMRTAAVGSTSVAVAALVGTTAALGSFGSLAGSAGGAGGSAAPAPVPSVAAPVPATARAAAPAPAPSSRLTAAPVPVASAAATPVAAPAPVAAPVPAATAPVAAPAPAGGSATAVPGPALANPVPIKGEAGPAALDAVSLPDPAPGFPLRRWADSGSEPTGFGAGQDLWTKAFGVSVTPYKMSADGSSGVPTGPEATVFVIDGAPALSGTVTGHPIVDGHQGTVVDYDNEHGLAFTAGRFTVQVWGSSTVTSDQLVALAASLRGLPS